MATQTREIKHQIALRKWSVIINECQQSGVFVEKWCEEHGIGVKSYYYWLKKVREATMKELPQEILESVDIEIVKDPLTPVALKPLVVEEPYAIQGNIVIHLPYGKVEVTGYMPTETIKNALTALREATC